MRLRHSSVLLAGVLALAACDQNSSPSDQASESAPSLATSADGNPLLVAMNTRLAARGLKVRVAQEAYVTSAVSGQAGQTLFAFDRGNKHIGSDYIPNDPRRHPGVNITYLVDQSDGATSTAPTLTSAQTEGAIDRAMTTWETSTQCSKDVAIDKVADPGVDPDIADGLILGNPALIGTPGFADIVHAGWLPAPFFDAQAPGGSQFILATTFTFSFVDANGNPTDLDNNGEFDTAFSETYYNDAFAWGIDVSIDPFDVETIALHESGHGLSQDHFGKIFRTESNGKVHFAPFAVMNAAISRQAHDLTGTDRAGHCSLWGSWPNK
jgi:hypothetical protein